VVRYVALGKESSFGSEASPTRYIDLARESISQRHDWIVPELASARWPKYALKGPIRVEGSLDMYVRADNIGEILMGVMGADNVKQPDPDNAPNVYEHSFTVAESLPSYTIYVASEITGRKFLGCVVRRVEFTCAPGELLGASVDFLGREEQSFTPGTPSWGEAPFFTFADCEALANDTPFKIKALSVRIENDLVDDLYLLGDRKLAEIPVRTFNIEGRFDAVFSDRTWLDRFLNAEFVKLEFKFRGAEIEAGWVYEITFTIPRAILTTAGAHIDRRDLLVEGVEFRAVEEPSTSEKIGLVFLRNKESSY